MIAGFGLDSPRFLHEHPPAPKILRYHAAVFTAWLFLLTAQVLRVLGDRMAWHRKLGWFMAGWACLMAVLGPWAAMASEAVLLHTPDSDPQFLSVNITDLLGFLILLAWGLSLRKNRAAHRRMMTLSMIALADPGFARFIGHLAPGEPKSVVLWFFDVFYGNVQLVAVIAGWDWWRGRLMRSYALGAAALLVGQFLAGAVYFWAPWKALTLAWVTVSVKAFG